MEIAGRNMSLEELTECEFGRFSVNDYRGLPDAPEFTFAEADLPVLVSAPHAVTHLRDGAVKPSEDFTGAIALAVARASGCHAIVATRTGAGDPNWDPLERSAYKQALCAYVRERGVSFVLAVHGMVAASDALVAIGSADGATVAARLGLDVRAHELLSSRLAEWSERHGKPIVLNGRYGARRPDTVAQTVARECGIAALQVEVATHLRVPTRRTSGPPRGERIPFTSGQLPVEISVRRAADPAAVLALIEALAEVVVQASMP